MADKSTQKQEQQIIVNGATTPIFYTDTIIMTVNEDGIVCNIGQKVGTTKQITIVSRFGMSKTHAQKFLKELNNLLVLSEKSKGAQKN